MLLGFSLVLFLLRGFLFFFSCFLSFFFLFFFLCVLFVWLNSLSRQLALLCPTALVLGSCRGVQVRFVDGVCVLLFWAWCVFFQQCILPVQCCSASQLLLLDFSWLCKDENFCRVCVCERVQRLSILLDSEFWLGKMVTKWLLISCPFKLRAQSMSTQLIQFGDVLHLLVRV